MEYREIKPYIEQGLIDERPHPENPDVRIFNYTKTCQYEKAWDGYTRECRGLVLNVKTGEVLARPYPKFFNYEEHIAYGWKIPDETPRISEKLDGSLGILVYVNDKPWIATRGSFMSDQAKWATKHFRQNYAHLKFDRELTYLFEIIYPENRVVVQYPFSDLVLLGAIRTKTGEDVDVNIPEMRMAERTVTTDITALKKMETPNSEGFVIYFPKANVRMKVKFSEYLRLHRIMTGINQRELWKSLVGDEKLLEMGYRNEKGPTLKMEKIVEAVPDEFFQWVTDTMNEIKENYKEIEDEVKHDAAEAILLPTAKEQAEFLSHKKYMGLSFSVIHGKDITKNIWKLVEPEGQGVFKVDVDA